MRPLPRFLTVLAALGVLVTASVTLTGSGNIGAVRPKWSVTQECTPVAPGDTSGSVGSASMDAIARSTSVFAIDNDFTLTDPTAGSFRGNVVASPVVGRKVHLDVAGKLNFLVADRTVDPVWFQGDATVNMAPLYRAGSPIAGSTLTNATIGGVAIDPFDGSYFIVTSGTVEIGLLLTWDYYVVTKYTAAGVYVTTIGSGSAGSANGDIGGAARVAVNPVNGAVAVGDGANSRIQIFTPNAGRTVYTYSTKVGTSGAGDSQFGSTQPIPVVYDSAGVLYAADRGNAQIKKFTVVGTTVTFVTKVAVSGFYSVAPIWDLTITSADVIYASLITSLVPGAPGTIRTYNTSLVAQSTITPPVPVGTSEGIMHIAADSTGIWAGWGMSNFIVHYPYAGGLPAEDKRWYSGRDRPTDINTPYALAVAPSGKVLVGMKNITTPSDLYLTPTQAVAFDWQSVPLSDAIENYMLECDATLGGMTYSYDASTDPNVIFPAWSGDVWSHLKEICTAFQLEIYLDGTVIRVEDVGARTITLRNPSPLKITPSNLFGGQQIVVIAQNPTAGGGTVYDASTQNTRFQIDVGQTQTVIVNTLNYPVSVDALVPTDTLPILPGQYYVLDSTGTHVPAASWVAASASVTPALGDSPGQVKFTLAGPSGAMSGYTGPFTFADSTASTGRAALILTGTGVFTAPVSYTFATGANPTKTTQLIARTINSFAIADMTQVARVTPAAIDDVSGYNVEVSFEIFTTDLLGFGLTQGAMFTAEDSRYRITNISWGAVKSGVTATRHVTLDDLDTITAGLTVDQRDAIWTGYSTDDRGIKPLALAL